jgi:mRNA-degrading endonuclease RelE of RelBE toxin-antitoxin system
MQYRRSANFKKSYVNLPEAIKEKTRKAFELFKQDWKHPSLNIKLIQGQKRKIYEGRINKYYRFTFELEDDIVYFRSIGRHDIIEAP